MTMRLMRHLAKTAAFALLTAALFWWFPSIETPVSARAADGPVATWSSR